MADEVTDSLLKNVFTPFGEIVDVQIPLDYETGKHRGFAFVEFENAEDAADAIDNMVNNPYQVINSMCTDVLQSFNLYIHSYPYPTRMRVKYLVEQSGWT